MHVGKTLYRRYISTSCLFQFTTSTKPSSHQFTHQQLDTTTLHPAKHCSKSQNMPSFLHASAQHCSDFMSHPDAHVVHLPSGYDLYFTLPFSELESRQPLQLEDLEALDDYLATLQSKIAAGRENPSFGEILQVRAVISHWLEAIEYLDDLELQAWTAGHGFPTFDEFLQFVDFEWAWEAIKFEGGHELSAAYFRLVHPAAYPHTRSDAERHNDYLTIQRAYSRFAPQSPKTIVDSQQYQNVAHIHLHLESDDSVSVAGAKFADMSECLTFLNTLTDSELALLKDEVVQLEGDSHNGIRVVSGPNAEAPTKQASWASKKAGSAQNEQHNRRSKEKAPQHSLQPLSDWEDFYQRGLISYDLTAETNGMVPCADLHLLKLYKAMRDAGQSGKDALQTVLNIKNIDPSSLLEGSSLNINPSRWAKEEYARMYSTGSQHPHVILQKDPIVFPERLAKQDKKPSQATKTGFRRVQRPVSQEVRSSTIQIPRTVQHEHASPAYHQPTLFYDDTLQFYNRRSEQKTRNEATITQKQSNHADALHPAHSRIGNNPAYESKKAAERPTQATAKQSVSSTSTQKPMKTYTSTPKIVYYEASNIPSATSTIKPYNPRTAHRTVSFQEPVRQYVRPRPAARSSSYDTGLYDSAQRMCGTCAYQAYAEDSPEDSPCAPAGSWRDV
jgi:hypothetical protein